MKKVMKKTIALAVALCMTLGAAVPAFAVENSAPVQKGDINKTSESVPEEKGTQEKDNVTEKDKQNAETPDAKEADEYYRQGNTAEGSPTFSEKLRSLKEGPSQAQDQYKSGCKAENV